MPQLKIKRLIVPDSAWLVFVVCEPWAALYSLDIVSAFFHKTLLLEIVL